MPVDYQAIREQAVARVREKEQEIRIFVGFGTCGIAAGARPVLAALQDNLRQAGVSARLQTVGCNGMCYQEPLVDIAKPGRPRISYGQVTPQLAAQLVDDYILGDNPRPDLALGVVGGDGYAGIPPLSEHPFFRGQVRLVMRNCGLIDPGDIDEYIARGGYASLHKALFEMTPPEVIAEVRKSGLRGRGGAGYPTGLKWEGCRGAHGSPKYLLINGEGGDPGAYMDRALMDSDPQAIIEGAVIAAYAIGCEQGYFFIRAEYPLAIERVQRALQQAEERGFLGDNILGSDFSFHLEIKRGPGAYVTGESTAVQFVIEGRQGTPRWRPPHSIISGLWAKPTTLNNVKTLVNVPLIIERGGEWYATIGTEKSRGTKVFALVGHVQRRGLVEFPLGITLRQLINDVGGGPLPGRSFKAVQTGGPLGGCLPAAMLDLPVDFDSLKGVGSMMGSGGIVVLDDKSCMVKTARHFLNFSVDESCGRCSACRIGSRRLSEILTRITQGRGQPGDIEAMETLGKLMGKVALCGLGRAAATPVLSTLRHFRDEYEAHIHEKRCPAGACEMSIS
ncbi:MAG: SLBB domain-containing protein [Anaerolineae bacterium]|jgi:NADH-quinone oxidoreductase subunit F|nr:SLBB domain-containing protein [Anaerolineae bacterium]MDH7475036.1 NADH-ubiquinone oxidoreductase-F iron-sulfur binding region domain-containing protein [Anaerolineae bacterium]